MKLFVVFLVSVLALGQTQISIPTLSKEIILKKSSCKLIKNGAGDSVVHVFLGRDEVTTLNRFEMQIPTNVIVEAQKEMKSINAQGYAKEYIANHKEDGNISILLEMDAQKTMKAFSLPEELSESTCKVLLNFETPQKFAVTASCQKIPPAMQPRSHHRIDFEVSPQTPIACQLD